MCSKERRHRMQICALCGWPTEVYLWVRPMSGGPRKPVFVCEDVCKEKKLGSLQEEGLKEANDILGWDVFKPIFRDEQ